ncbi:hypothetical protein MES5069_270207 [Mesorhizobium escarrei]|uniref:Uncharacterized protein n=1 Tax=Mesorhizobium escarrei TaxID=666018 RepID=A0ABN8JSL9_9HYPH|nr:hypothetical protein MES5069_270207 [Mesorhizobium escarrei]
MNILIPGIGMKIDPDIGVELLPRIKVCGLEIWTQGLAESAVVCLFLQKQQMTKTAID